MVIVKPYINDRFKLLDVYIDLLVGDNRHLVSDEELLDMLKLEFNFDVSLNEIREHFHSNLNDDQYDLMLQARNLGIRYE